MWIAAVLITIIISVYFYLDTRKPKNFPPGPPWLPIIGCALTVEKYRQKMGILSLATAQMAKDYAGGKILGLKIGNELQVIVTSTEGYREVGANHKLDGRPTGPLYTEKSLGLNRGILLTDGEFWQEQHRFLVQHLREYGFGKSSDEKNITREVKSLIDYFKTLIKNSRSGVATIEMHHAFGISVINNLMMFMIGTRFEPDDIEVRKLHLILTELLDSISMIGCLFHFFPILRFIAPEASGYTRYMMAVNKGTEICQELIDKHKETYKPDITRDFIDSYIKEIQSRGQDASSFSELQLINIYLDLFMAGSDTTSKVLGFGFLHFLRHPDVVKKAQEEMDRVVGRDRMINLDDKPNLPYTEACTYEALRMFTGLTFNIPHRALEDTTLLGYFIPKDTTVVINTCGPQINENFIQDPWSFKPERHLDDDGKLKIHDDLIMFGLGRRRCMGEIYSKKSIFLFISNILHTFNVTNPEGVPLPDPFPLEGVLPGPQPYEAEVTLRTS